MKTLLLTTVFLGAVTAQAVTVKSSVEEGMERNVTITTFEDWEEQPLYKPLPRSPHSGTPERKVKIYPSVDTTNKIAVGVFGVDTTTPENLYIPDQIDGYSVEVLRIIDKMPERYKILIDGRDKNGKAAAPQFTVVQAVNNKGQPVCFEVQTIAQQRSPVHYFSLLIDKSGSMSGETFKTLKREAKRFLSSLPSNSQCRVLAFNSSVEQVHKGEFEACGIIDVSGLKATGGTELYQPLQGEFTRYKDPFYQNKTATVVMITDGQIAEDKATKANLQTLKGNTYNLVYFMGQKQEKHLVGLADNFVDENTIDFTLTEYLKGVAGTINKQRVLSQIACKP